MAVSYIDFGRMHKPFKDDFMSAFEARLQDSDFILGGSMETFEKNFAQMMGAKHAIGVASGTDALLLTLHAIGVQPGDEVICPAFGFVATAEVIARLGATVVFADIRSDYNIDPETVRAAITEKTKAIIPVHLFGQACDMNALTQIAADYGVYLVEDVAQASGALWGERYLGTFGIAGCFSFYPTKNLGAMGDGGLILTDSDELADRAKLFRNHGADEDGKYTTIGYNSRLDSIQASMLNVKLPNLEEDNADRVANASFYENHLAKDVFELPPFLTDGSHTFNNYTIRFSQRDALRSFLAERYIETRVYYSAPLHLAPCFEYLGYAEGHFPESEKASAEVLSIPVYPGLTRHELEEVVHVMELFVQTHPVPATT